MFAVVVSQVKPNGGIAVAIGGSEMYLPNQPDLGRRCQRHRHDRPVLPGGATAAAWASVAHDDGSYWSYQWTLPVQLQ